MKFVISKASNWDFKKEIEISTLGELFRLMDKYGCDLIVGREYYPTGDIFENNGYEAKGTIIIYDDYVE